MTASAAVAFARIFSPRPTGACSGDLGTELA
jgi:hypothetical protein